MNLIPLLWWSPRDQKNCYSHDAQVPLCSERALTFKWVVDTAYATSRPQNHAVNGCVGVEKAATTIALIRRRPANWRLKWILPRFVPLSDFSHALTGQLINDSVAWSYIHTPQIKCVSVSLCFWECRTFWKFENMKTFCFWMTCSYFYTTRRFIFASLKFHRITSPWMLWIV